MLKPELTQVTYGTAIRAPEDIKTIELDSIIADIRNGRWKKQINQIRTTDNAELAKTIKTGLPYFLYGIFKGKRSNECLVQMNGAILDYDHIPDIEGFKTLVMERIPEVRYAFQSPRDGVKILIPFSRPVTDEDEYRAVFELLKSDTDQRLNAKDAETQRTQRKDKETTCHPEHSRRIDTDSDADISTKLNVIPDKDSCLNLAASRLCVEKEYHADNTPDPARACFISYDPDLTENEYCSPFDVDEFMAEYDTRKIDEMHPKEMEKNLSSFLSSGINECEEPDEVVINAVDYLASIKLDYNAWIKVGLAIFHTYGDKAFPLWDKFSANPNYSDTTPELARRWKSFQNANSVSVGSIIHIAKHYGWEGTSTTEHTEIAENTEKEHGRKETTCHPEHSRRINTESGADISTMLNVTPDVDSLAGLAPSRLCVEKEKADEYLTYKSLCLSGEKEPNGKALLSQKDMQSVFAKMENVPLEADKLPQFMRDYIALADKVTDAPQGAKLTAFLTVIAANIGNRVYMHNIGGRVFCNIWSITIGPSSVSRKTTVLSLARSTMQTFEDGLDSSSVKDYERETVWLSNVTGAKLLSLLSVNPNRLFHHNEISGFLAEISKNYNQGMKQKITEIYDGVSVSNLNMERCERIKNPALSILAASTESWFYQQLASKTEQLSGFMQRFLYCIISDINVRNLNFDYVDTSLYRGEFHRYEEVYRLFRELPLSFRLKAGEQALSYRNGIYKERLIDIYELHNDPILSYFSRLYDGYWYKFCILITLFKEQEKLRLAYEQDIVPEFFESVEVTEQTATESMYLCDYYFDNTLPLMKMMSEQNRLSGERKLVELLAKRFGGRAAHTELMQMAHFDRKEMNSKIDTLLDMEVIRVETGNHKTKPVKIYVLDEAILRNLTK